MSIWTGILIKTLFVGVNSDAKKVGSLGAKGLHCDSKKICDVFKTKWKKELV